MLNSRWNVLSWASPFVAISLMAFLFTSSIGQGQSPSMNDSSRAKTSHEMICTISAFFSIDSNEQIASSIRIEGRGLATCKNDQGFSTDVPVSAVVNAKAMGSWSNAGELSFSGNSASFVIPREIGQLQDTYSIKSFASDLNDKTSPTLLFEGAQHDLMIEMKLSSTTHAFEKIEITGMNLHFDEAAPTLD